MLQSLKYQSHCEGQTTCQPLAFNSERRISGQQISGDRLNISSYARHSYGIGSIAPNICKCPDLHSLTRLASVSSVVTWQPNTCGKDGSMVQETQGNEFPTSAIGAVLPMPIIPGHWESTTNPWVWIRGGGGGGGGRGL